MRPATSVSTAEIPGQPVIKLRDPHFVRVTNFLGHADDAKRARFCRVDYNTLRKARAGGSASHVFIANTLAALEPYRGLLAEHRLDTDFDALFELVREER